MKHDYLQKKNGLSKETQEVLKRCILLLCVVKVLADSPSISGAVIRRCWLQFHIQFISLLAAYSSLPAAAVLCLMSYALPSFLK